MYWLHLNCVHLSVSKSIIVRTKIRFISFPVFRTYIEMTRCKTVAPPEIPLVRARYSNKRLFITYAI